jgi:hypothetical protein
MWYGAIERDDLRLSIERRRTNDKLDCVVELRREKKVSVEQLDVVDVISIEKQTGHVVLTISDHLEWSKSAEHQIVLQAKFNKYLAFIESGEIFTRYPDARGRPVAIRVVFKHKPDRKGFQFLAKARAVVESAGFSLRHELFAESYGN